MVSLGKNEIYIKPSKRKLNIKISTLAELLGVYYRISAVILSRDFLEAQGIWVEYNTVFQYNYITMLMEKNGKFYNGKCMRHLNICYFFVAVWIDLNQVSVQYCPTGDMIGDLFPKTLQGDIFHKFRSLLINIYEWSHAYQSNISGVCWGYLTLFLLVTHQEDILIVIICIWFGSGFWEPPNNIFNWDGHVETVQRMTKIYSR